MTDFVRHRVLDYDDYWFDLDEYKFPNGQQHLLAHLGFTNFTRDILKRVLREWRLFRQCVTAPIFATRDDGDVDKWVHFVSLLGFKPTGVFITCNNGERRELFIHTVPNDKLQTNDPKPVSVAALGTAGGSALHSVQ